MSDETISYDDARRQLELTETELDALVTRGDLDAIHDGGEMRFKMDDVDLLRRSRETEPTIVLSDTDAEDFEVLSTDAIDLDAISTDDTVLNIEGLLEDETEGTTPIPGSDLLEDDILEGGDDLLLGDDTVVDTDDLDLDLDDDTILAGDDTLLAAGASRPVTLVREKPSTAMIAVLAIGLVIAIGPLVLALSLVASPEGVFGFGADSMMTKVGTVFEPILGLFR